MQKRTFIDSTYLKESAHNLKKEFFSLKPHITRRICRKKTRFEHSAIFDQVSKKSPTFFFESFLERLLTNLSLKFELTRTIRPIVLGVRQLKLGSCHGPIPQQVIPFTNALILSLLTVRWT